MNSQAEQVMCSRAQNLYFVYLGYPTTAVVLSYCAAYSANYCVSITDAAVKIRRKKTQHYAHYIAGGIEVGL
jgi:hypothetical protein